MVKTNPPLYTGKALKINLLSLNTNKVLIPTALFKGPHPLNTHTHIHPERQTETEDKRQGLLHLGSETTDKQQGDCEHNFAVQEKQQLIKTEFIRAAGSFKERDLCAPEGP